MAPKPLWTRFKSRAKKIVIVGMIGAAVGAIGANFIGRATPQFKSEYARLSAAERAGFIAGKTSALSSQNLWQKINPRDRTARGAQVKTIEAQADRHLQLIGTKARLAKEAAGQTARFAGPELSRAGIARAGKGAKWGAIIGAGFGTGLPWVLAKTAFKRRGRGKRRQ